MGRRKKYNRVELIDAALDVFRIHGFSDTSTQMLVDALGINRYSLYAEFHSKLDLFDAVLDRYNDTVIERSFSRLEGAQSGIKEIHSILRYYESAIDGPVAGKGCLLCNTAIEFGAANKKITHHVDRYYKRLSDAFSNALRNEKDNGTLKVAVSVQAEAQFFTSIILGIFVMIRSKAPQAAVKRTVKVAREHLSSLVKE